MITETPKDISSSTALFEVSDEEYKVTFGAIPADPEIISAILVLWLLSSSSDRSTILLFNKLSVNVILPSSQIPALTPLPVSPISVCTFSTLLEVRKLFSHISSVSGL